MKQIANIHYEIADTPEMILAAKQLCHDVYLGHGYIDHPYTEKIIPNNSDETAVYFVALTDDREVVGTIRLNLGQSFDTLKAWGNKIYAGSRQRIERRYPGTVDRVLDRDLCADLAGGTQGAIRDRDLAGGIDQVAESHGRHIGRRWRNDRRQAQSKIAKPFRWQAHVAVPGAGIGRLRYATRFSGLRPGITCTSSHPSCPQLSRICLVACTNSGTVTYSHLVMPSL